MQRSELMAAHESRSSANGPNNQVTDDELLRRLELKDEEVKLYKNKYEECSKQLLQAVCYCSLCILKMCFISGSLFGYIVSLFSVLYPLS